MIIETYLIYQTKSLLLQSFFLNDYMPSNFWNKSCWKYPSPVCLFMCPCLPHTYPYWDLNEAGVLVKGIASCSIGSGSINIHTSTETNPSPNFGLHSSSRDFKAFKSNLDKALSSLIWSHSWPCFEQEAGLNTTWGPFQTYSFFFASVVLCRNPLQVMLFLTASWSNRRYCFYLQTMPSL